MSEGICFLLTKCLFPAEEGCSRYSVNSNIHWASVFPWSLISFDSVLYYTLESGFPKTFAPWQDITEKYQHEGYCCCPHSSRTSWGHNFIRLDKWRAGTGWSPSACSVPGPGLASGHAEEHREHLSSPCGGGKIERDLPSFNYRKYYSSK